MRDQEPKMTRDDQILSLAERLEAMRPHARLDLDLRRPGLKRNIKVERTGAEGEFAWVLWNVGRADGLLHSDALETAEIIIEATA